MLEPLLIQLGINLIIASAAFTWGRITAPQPHMSVTDLLMQGERLHEEAQEVLRSNVVQFSRRKA